MDDHYWLEMLKVLYCDGGSMYPIIYGNVPPLNIGHIPCNRN
jgi:hypothetical protein